MTYHLTEGTEKLVRHVRNIARTECVSVGQQSVVYATASALERHSAAVRAVLELCEEMHAAYEGAPEQDALAYEIEKAIEKELGNEACHM